MRNGPGTFCGSCGATVPEGAKFCAECGVSTEFVEADPVEETGVGTSSSVEDEPPKRRKRWKSWLVPIGAVIVASTIGLGVAFAVLDWRAEATDYLLVGEPQRGDSELVDLYLVGAGADVTNDDRIARDVWLSSITTHDNHLLNDSRRRGLVVLPSGDVAVSYQDEDTSVVAIGSITDWDATNQVFDSDYVVDSHFETGTNALVIVEHQEGGGERCYVFGSGADANRLARSDSTCLVSLTLGAVFVEHEPSDGGVDVSVSDLEGKELTALTRLDGYDATLSKERLFYVDEADSGVELVAVEWRTETETARSRPFDSIEILGSARDAVVFVGDNGEGSLSLSVVNNAGTVHDVAEAFEVAALLSDDGRWLFYATADEQGDWELSATSLDPEPGTAIDLGPDGTDISGLRFFSVTTADDAEPFLILQTREGEEFDVYGGTPTSGATNLFTTLSGGFTPGYAGGLAFLSGTNAYEGSGGEPLYVYDMSSERLIEIDERWDSAYWLDVSDGGAALIAARDGNEEILYYVSPGASPDVVELDGADAISSASFGPDGTTVWYSVVDRGESEVRRVTISDNPQVEILYEDARILGASWETHFTTVSTQSSGASAFVDPVARECRAAGLQMVEYGTTRTMTGPVTGTRDVCLSLREETNFEIRAVANNDVDLTMSVESEYELGSNDDSNGGRNPYLNLGLLPPGTYRVRVGAYNSSSWTADFDLITDRLLGTDDAAAGEAIYLGTCAACHGADATGIDGLGKDLHANTFIIENSNGAMLAFLRVGRPASDPDNDTGVDMPPQGGNPSLSDQDLQNVVAYLRTLQ